MKTLTQSMSVALLGMCLAIPLTACDSKAEVEANDAPVLSRAAAPAKCYNCGTISNVRTMTAEGESSGLGIAIGAVVGAVAGHQVGDGRGQDAATVGGAVVGGIAGHEIEKHVKGTPYFHVTVNMDNGGCTRTINVAAMNGLASGSRVKIVGNDLHALS